MSVTAIGLVENQRVRWAGKRDPRCRPGTTGVVLKVAHHDEGSVKVLWDDRHPSLGRYTWERRANLEFVA